MIERENGGDHRIADRQGSVGVRRINLSPSDWVGIAEFAWLDREG